MPQQRTNKPKQKPVPKAQPPPLSTPDLKPKTFEPRSHIIRDYVAPPSASQVRRFRRPALIGIGFTAAALSFYPVFTYITYRNETKRLAANPPPADTSYKYDSCAEVFDDSVEWTEWWLGLGKLRRQLLEKSRGNVLEVSVGTGRNAKYYPLMRDIRSVTMVDQSREMVRMARINWAKTNAWFINAVFRLQSAAEPVLVPLVVRPGEAEKERETAFDTVVQTMGICSTGDPVSVLQNLGRMCKPDGQILLLEHGRGHYDWVNRLLDAIAPAHAERWGCWFNKDIGAIVKESRLEVVEQRRYHLGTTWWFVLKPPADRTLLQVATGQVVGSAEEEKTSTGWKTWWK